jgi:hypothetical protein
VTAIEKISGIEEEFKNVHFPTKPSLAFHLEYLLRAFHVMRQIAIDASPSIDVSETIDDEFENRMSEELVL